ncbi:hypothetical protein CEUSTIGMA_g8976.t1 [Chlamydomonas eustigma]|uniref:Uncharacterized protein n=1 Tax=Chlamydomonas eustigma TaxID=1157962 RepID=A0A250XEP2_9CHLO|nr:hypothetical protein CEUSTIGMA_g8976.t1 [Chlamydomonas eustigma]|eukprot:GAX81548.1 hypothetical protein CEUSTIGMA_g8976.t1 [Chlamydomonas eustigma]
MSVYEYEAEDLYGDLFEAPVSMLPAAENTSLYKATVCPTLPTPDMVQVFHDYDVKELKASLENNSKLTEELSRQLLNVQSKCSDLERERALLIKNMSVLFKTATLELERKNKEIKSLRETVLRSKTGDDKGSIMVSTTSRCAGFSKGGPQWADGPVGIQQNMPIKPHGWQLMQSERSTAGRRINTVDQVVHSKDSRCQRSHTCHLRSEEAENQASPVCSRTVFGDELHHKKRQRMEDNARGIEQVTTSIQNMSRDTGTKRVLAVQDMNIQHKYNSHH